MDFQFRLMENEKAAFLEDRMKKSRQQRKLIDMLSREKEQLQQQLSYVHEGPHARKERQDEQKMHRLNEDIETNQKLLSIEKVNLPFLRRREAVTPIWISASTAVPATATVDIHVWLAETSAR